MNNISNIQVYLYIVTNFLSVVQNKCVLKINFPYNFSTKNDSDNSYIYISVCNISVNKNRILNAYDMTQERIFIKKEGDAIK